MNKKGLLSVMAKFGDNGNTLSDYLGMTKQTFSKKLNEKSPFGFTQPEILQMKKKYDLNATEIDNIFFGNSVS